MSDRIRIRGLEVFANHGVYEEEDKAGTEILGGRQPASGYPESRIFR